MRHAAVVLISASAIVLVSSVSTLKQMPQTEAIAAPPDQAIVMKKMTAMPLAFTKNEGQWDERVQFRADAGAAVMWFTTDGVYYQFTRRIARETILGEESDPMNPLLGRLSDDRLDHERDSIETLCVKATFVGANPAPEVTGEEMMAYKCNYFLGNDQAQWRTDVPNYRAVVFRDVYEGINLKYYGTRDGQMEYDFVVAPGADVGQIQVRYEGAASLSVDGQGRLVVSTPWTDVIENRPHVFQERGGQRAVIGGEYVLLGEGVFGFALDARYDAALPVVIDPVLSYSTYLGGGSSDDGWGIAVDASGSAYVTGSTHSTDFPTANPFQAANAGINDVFVTKLSASGTALVYSTYLGGSDNDFGRGIAVDGSGSAYVAGWTWSADFPTANPLQATNGGQYDVFVIKLSASGSTLVYSTYLGGSNWDEGTGIAIDGLGSAYVTGATGSTDFPTANPFQAATAGDDDAFVTKLSASGTALVYSTYLGGSGNDHGEGIAVDGSGDAYVTGWTVSSNFPTANPFQAAYAGGSGDAFVTRLSASGTALVYSTYLGGSGWDEGRGIAVDGSGSAYVTGYTESTNFPTANPFQAANAGGDDDAFVTKLSASGGTLVYSTYLGGSSRDEGVGIAVDASRSAYVTGHTESTDFPTANPFQAALGGGSNDAFVAKLANPPPCDCPFQSDFDGDGFLTALDLSAMIDILFAGQPDVQDPDCPSPRADFDCDGFSTALDLSGLIDHLFAGGDGPCDPCAP